MSDAHVRMVNATVAERNDFAFVLLVAEDSVVICCAGAAPRDDRDLMLDVARNSGRLFCFASERLRGDADVAEKAIVFQASAFQHASEAVRGCRPIARMAVCCDGRILQHVSKKLKEDFCVMWLAVRNSAVVLTPGIYQKKPNETLMELPTLRITLNHDEVSVQSTDGYVSSEGRCDVCHNVPDLVLDATRVRERLLDMRECLQLVPLLAPHERTWVFIFVPAKRLRAVIERLLGDLQLAK